VFAAKAALIGAATGAAGYTAGKIWDCIFKGDSAPTTEKVTTFAENDNMTVGQTSQGSHSIPTLSEWKQIFLTLFMLSLVMGFIYKSTSKPTFSNNSSLTNLSNFLIFDVELYKKVAKWIGVVVVLALAGATAIFGHMAVLDIMGALFCMPLVAYIIHLVIMFIRDYQYASA
jgi:hypothetical protein